MYFIVCITLAAKFGVMGHALRMLRGCAQEGFGYGDVAIAERSWLVHFEPG